MSDLQFESIRIKNFKSFFGEHFFKLDRGPGLFYISGENQTNPELETNGVGKTTLWDALTWVFWNKTCRDNKPASAVVPWGMDKGSVEVSVKFSRGGRHYKLTRTYRPNSLELVNSKTPDKVREIAQSEVADLIGMTEETFRRTLVIGQFHKLFLDLKAEEQSGMFSDACNLMVWLKAAELARESSVNADKECDIVKADIHKLAGQITELSKQVDITQELAINFESEIKRKIRAFDKALEEKQLILEKVLEKHEIRAPRSLEERQTKLKALQRLALKQNGSWEALGRDLEDCKVELRSLQKSRRDAEELIEQYNKMIGNDRICPECGQTVSYSHLKEKVKKLELQIAEDSQLIKTAEENLNSMEENYAENRSATNELSLDYQICTNAIQEINTLEATRKLERESTNPHDVSYYVLRRRDLRKEKNKFEDVRNKLEEMAAIGKYWSGAFKEIRLSIIDNILVELEMTVTKYVEALGLRDWRIEFRTERINKSGNVSVAFTVYLYPPEQEEPIKWESYSGGESQRWQLAVAFGLSEVLLGRAGVSPNIEVLDEPTKWVSATGVDNLLEALSERAKQTGRTIYFVDHHSLDSGRFEGVIRIVHDQKGSRICQ